ncbi:hypothetical protein [Pseudomonas kitaguniensis]|uniref:hypothetical protein n=1 Tax=Pseudomonas kitaguniensis TaxID=2607908 RepID=UPI003BA23A1E
MNKKIRFICIVLLASVFSGCGDHKGEAFEGKWTEDLSKRAPSLVKIPSTLNIRSEDGVYHIDYASENIFLKKIDVVRLEATPTSNAVLSVNSGLVSINMRLENKRVFFDSKEFYKE